ncbi:MAG TPA: hypothetical protein VJP78_11465, partial [Thermoleophilia bacterium]|nr:hypothetical protein [Thermoleophilia bacterium]
MKPRPESRYLRPLVALATLCALAFVALGAIPSTAEAEPTTPVETAAAPKAFTDVRGDEEFAEAVYALTETGIVAG